MNPRLRNLIIFILIFTYFFLLQGTTHFADPDCFYNTKMALLMKDRLVFKEFPWLQFSLLKDNYVDHHFLYHVFLIPFVSLEKIGINSLLGVRLSAIFFATLLIFIFYLILNNLSGFTQIATRKNADVFNPSLFFIFLLLISAPFIFRISLARAPAISGIFLLLGTYFIINRSRLTLIESADKTLNKKKRFKMFNVFKKFSIFNDFNIFLFLISFFYVWLYSAWLLLPAILFFYIVGSIIADKNKLLFGGTNKPAPGTTWSQQNIGQKIFSGIRTYSQKIRTHLRINLGKIISCLSGIILGLIINPYFPQNIKFYYHQIYQIAVVNFHHKFGVGSEWYPYDLITLYKNLFIFFIILLISVALFFVLNKKFAFAQATADGQGKKSWTLFLITIFFFIYTLKARRSVEYLVPFGVLFIAFVWDNLFEKKSWPELEQKFKEFFTKKQQLVLIALTCLLVLIAPYFIINDLINTHKHLQNFRFDHLQKLSYWLKQKVEPGKIIFNSNWDEFGFLFYYNSQNYYITGLDQTFMYSYDPNLLELYVDITRGLNIINLKDNLKNKFNSEYILLAKNRNKNFYHHLELLDKDFELVYEDEEASVFTLINTDVNTDEH